MTRDEYNVILKKKVINFLAAGYSQRLAGEVFKMSTTTINKINTEYKKIGTIPFKKNFGARPSINLEIFKQYVRKNPSLNAKKIAHYFDMSASGARYWLKKLGFYYVNKGWQHISLKNKLLRKNN